MHKLAHDNETLSLQNAFLCTHLQIHANIFETVADFAFLISEMNSTLNFSPENIITIIFLETLCLSIFGTKTVV